MSLCDSTASKCNMQTQALRRLGFNAPMEQHVGVAAQAAIIMMVLFTMKCGDDERGKGSISWVKELTDRSARSKKASTIYIK